VNIESFRVTKVTPGLSSFSDTYREKGVLSTYIKPLLIQAATIIPQEYYSKTEVYIQGTAGMRLLNDSIQEEMWRVMMSELLEDSSIPFHNGISLRNVGTIDGRSEAYYAVLASNYIAGKIDTSLRPIDGAVMLGALDMGGSSTQLIFHSGDVKDEPVSSEDFWMHSYIALGKQPYYNPI
jgi:Golgi nucleoside diphosphatase